MSTQSWPGRAGAATSDALLHRGAQGGQAVPVCCWDEPAVVRWRCKLRLEGGPSCSAHCIMAHLPRVVGLPGDGDGGPPPDVLGTARS